MYYFCSVRLWRGSGFDWVTLKEKTFWVLHLEGTIPNINLITRRGTKSSSKLTSPLQNVFSCIEHNMNHCWPAKAPTGGHPPRELNDLKKNWHLLSSKIIPNTVSTVLAQMLYTSTDINIASIVNGSWFLRKTTSHQTTSTFTVHVNSTLESHVYLKAESELFAHLIFRQIKTHSYTHPTICHRRGPCRWKLSLFL